MNYKEKAYDEAIKQLRMHAPLIWQRCGFFLGSQSALLIFYCNRTRQMPFLEPIVICMMGIVVSIVWLRITTQGRDIQREWRKKVIKLEKQLFSESDGVERPFTFADKDLKEGHNPKVSITFWIRFLAVSFIVAWGMLACIYVADGCSISIKQDKKIPFFMLNAQIQASDDNPEGRSSTVKQGSVMPESNYGLNQTSQTESELNGEVREKKHRGDIVVYELPVRALDSASE